MNRLAQEQPNLFARLATAICTGTVSQDWQC
jgi:hypothetical protein